jgi:DNA-binding XRE family transcriptional regulator
MNATEFRATLKQLSLTQRELAARLGLATSTVNRWATDDFPIPKYAIAYLELMGKYQWLTEYAKLMGKLYERDRRNIPDA